MPVGHTAVINSAAFSSDGEYLLTGSSDGIAKLWNAQEKELHTFFGKPGLNTSVDLSPEGHYILMLGNDTITLYDLQGNNMRSLTDKNGIRSANFTPDGMHILIKTEKNFELKNFQGGLVRTFEGVSTVSCSPDGKHILTGNEKGANLLDEQGKKLRGFEAGAVQTAAFSPNGKHLLTNTGNQATLWDLQGNALQSFKGRTNHQVAFTSDGQHILTYGDDHATLWNLQGTALKQLVWDRWGGDFIAFSPDGKSVLTATQTSGEAPKRAVLWDWDGQVLQDFDSGSGQVLTVDFSPDGTRLLTGSWNQPLKIWNVKENIVRNLAGPSGTVYSATFYPDGQHILTGDQKKVLHQWNLQGHHVQHFPLGWDDPLLKTVATTTDGRQPFMTGPAEAELQRIPHEFLQKFKGHTEPINAVAFSADGSRILTGSEDHTAKLWDTATGQEIATLVSFDSTDWIVTTPSGLFEASHGEMTKMHYSVFDKKHGEYVTLGVEQLKARYYEPGLLQKLFGHSDEPIRPVEVFDEVRLYPRIETKLDTLNSMLHIELFERNGGIGKVSIFINGKEVVEEANPLHRGEYGKRDSIIHYDLKPHQNYLFHHPDSINSISIRAYNEEGWLKSPAVHLEYRTPMVHSRGSNSSDDPSEWTGQFEPKLYVISIGTSDYSGTRLDLQYADQDATMMARALQAVGTGLFIDGDSLEVHCLTTAKPDANGLEGTPIQWHSSGKSNVKAVFTDIKERAKAEDVIVVYLSGHGVTQGGMDHTLFYYLTKDIASEDALADPVTRREFAISSEELTDWLKAIPALKQVLIIDACHSGQIVKNLTDGTKALNSSQIRALDRMQDRTGMFVLSGSAADKVSYEASEYGQGLLTYALLEGMRAATRTDSDGKEMVNMVDVMTLFQYARDRVPKLAGSINGVQTPMLAFPKRAASFDIGILNEAADTAIPTWSKKPVLIRSTFLNEATYRDDLKLADRLEAAFREETKKGAEADLVYVDVHDYPNAYSLGGIYRETAAGVDLRVKLLRGKETPVTLDIPITEDPERLVKLIVRAVKRQVR